jgi:hypothetical protein
VAEVRAPGGPVPAAEPLRAFFRDTVAPYLRAGTGSRSPLRQPRRAAALFDAARDQLPTTGREVLAILEGLCAQRRRLDAQAAFDSWLRGSRRVHLTLAIALMGLMGVHAWAALTHGVR